jgi:TonB family protein
LPPAPVLHGAPPRQESETPSKTPEVKPSVPKGPKAAPAARAASVTPVRVGGTIKPPQKTRDVRPVYPPIAHSARVQGVVIIEATIGPAGAVQDAKVIRSIPLLDQAALEAVRQWVFTPTLLNGIPVPVIMTVTVQFTLVGARDLVVAYVRRLETTNDVVRATEMLRGVFGAENIYGPQIFQTLVQYLLTATDEQITRAEGMIPKNQF